MGASPSGVEEPGIAPRPGVQATAVKKKGDQEGQEPRSKVAINNEISKGLESKENGRNLLADSVLGKRKEGGMLDGAGDFEEQLHFWSARPQLATAREGHVTDSTEPDSVPLEKENLVTETSLDAREGPVVNTSGRALVAAREDGRESDNKGGPKSDLERREIYGRQVQIQEIRVRRCCCTTSKNTSFLRSN
jgi:hypothetical protein